MPRRLAITGPHKVEVLEYQDPPLQANQALVKTELASGKHGTTLAWEKIVFGSDVAHYETHDVLHDYDNLFRSLNLAEEIRWKILGGTAAKIYKL